MNDVHTFLDALTGPKVHFSQPSEEKYYLVDSSYPCTFAFLSPYWSKWYHLQEYYGRHNQSISYKELLNYRHSSFQNIFEAFDVLKTQFPILRMIICYKPSRQSLIVITCCILHNWIRLSTWNNQLLRDFEVQDW